MLLPFVVSLLVLADPAQQECRYEDTRTAELSGARTLLVHAGSGELRVEGRAGVDAVQIEAHLCASSQELLSAMRLETGVMGGSARVRTNLPDRNENNSYARMDLVIVVPQGMPAGIEDGSGSTELSGLGDTEIVDGSGNLDVTEIGGSLDIDDGSGALMIEDVAGDVVIDDGSGDLSLRAVQGAIAIDDGSGAIGIVDARRNVTIDDSSGGIEARGVGGDFTVDDDGSGGIRYSDVTGAVRIPRDKRPRG
ncbi:MAG: hypothetical protein ACREKM_10870 [Longimicrobiales bacterium]